MSNMFKKFFSSLAVLLFAGGIYGENFDFVNKDISEILYAVSVYRGVSISCDDTVSGKGDFRMNGENFEKSFEMFLSKNRLFAKKNDWGWIVSRYCVERTEDGEFVLDAFDMTPVMLFEKAGKEMNLCVTYDSLPSVKLSIHTGKCSGEEVIRRITALCSGFEMSVESTGFIHVGRVAKINGVQAGASRQNFYQSEDKSWTCDVMNATLQVALEKFFMEAKKQFCFLSGNEEKISRTYFSGKSFEESLKLLCSSGGCDFVEKDGIYYVVKNKNPAEKKNGFYKAWESLQLKYSSADAFIRLAQKRFPGIEIVNANDTGLIMFFCGESEKKELTDFARKYDVENSSYFIQLKNIAAKELMNNLPPYVAKNQIHEGVNRNSIYFTGTEEMYNKFLEDLKILDKKVQSVSYDLLIIQYQSSMAGEWNPSLSLRKNSYGDISSAVLQAGSVLDFNFDVVSAFGFKFACKLEAAINNSKAKVFADTTLSGISGSTINFQNTNTYRYRDNNLDPETGKPVYSGITREIVSGLKLEIIPSVSGDGTITSKVTASVSRQGTDTSARTGNPPPSSEKVICTEVCSKSGESVVLSGLVQKEENVSEQRFPLLSKIPLLGLLFKSRNKDEEQSELVIYLLPVCETETEKSGLTEKEIYRAEMKRLYQEVFDGEEV